MAENKRDIMKPGNFGFDVPIVFELIDAHGSGRPWYFEKEDEYQGNKTYHYWYAVRQRDSGKEWSLKASSKMHTEALLPLHNEHGLGKGATFSIEKQKDPDDGRKCTYAGVFIQAGNAVAPGAGVNEPSTGGAGGQQRGGPSSSPAPTANGGGRSSTPRGGPGLKDKYAVYVYSSDQGAACIKWAREQTDAMFADYTDAETGLLPLEVLEAWQKVYATNLIFAGGIEASEWGAAPVGQRETKHPVDELRAQLYDMMLEANLAPDLGGKVLMKLFISGNRPMHAVLKEAIDEWEDFAILVRAEMQDAAAEAGNVDGEHLDDHDQTGTTVTDDDVPF